MKTLKAQKKMAAKILKVGVNRVWFDPSRIIEIKEAITKQDIDDLIQEKAIKKKPLIGFKKRALRKKLARKKKGRRRGHGRIKRKIKKEKYHQKVRKLRRYLKGLMKEKKISKEKYNLAYKLIKSGMIRSKHDVSSLKLK